MEWMAVLTSGGRLNVSAAEKSISDSLFFEYGLLLSIQPFFLSQEQTSFAEVTGLEEARICASKLAWGEKSQLPSDDMLLLLELRDELWGLFFVFVFCRVSHYGRQEVE